MSVEITTEQLNKLLSDTVTAALLAIQTTPAIPQASQPVNEGTRSQTKKPDRPLLEQGIDDAQWQFFTEEWKLYKQMANLTVARIINTELRSCCS